VNVVNRVKTGRGVSQVESSQDFLARFILLCVFLFAEFDVDCRGKHTSAGREVSADETVKGVRQDFALCHLPNQAGRKIGAEKSFSEKSPFFRPYFSASLCADGCPMRFAKMRHTLRANAGGTFRPELC
jgi:hypothetical protein